MITQALETEIVRLHRVEHWPIGTIAQQLRLHHSTVRRVLAQADWAHFGKLSIGRAQRPLMAFVMVLSYSRHLFLHFYFGAAMANFIRGHVEAFSAFNASPRIVLYDNLKSVVLERVGEAIRFHPTLLELAAHYRFQPRPVGVGRGNEKACASHCLLCGRWSRN